MSKLVILASFLAALCGSAYAGESSFATWKQQYGKIYGPEEMLRQQVFEENLRDIERHNSQNSGYRVSRDILERMLHETTASLLPFIRSLQEDGLSAACSKRVCGSD